MVLFDVCKLLQILWHRVFSLCLCSVLSHSVDASFRSTSYCIIPTLVRVKYEIDIVLRVTRIIKLLSDGRS